MERHIGDFNCTGEMCMYKMHNVLNWVLVLLCFVSYTYICYMKNTSSFQELVEPISLPQQKRTSCSPPLLLSFWAQSWPPSSSLPRIGATQLWVLDHRGWAAGYTLPPGLIQTACQGSPTLIRGRVQGRALWPKWLSGVTPWQQNPGPHPAPNHVVSHWDLRVATAATLKLPNTLAIKWWSFRLN